MVNRKAIKQDLLRFLSDASRGAIAITEENKYTPFCDLGADSIMLYDMCFSIERRYEIQFEPNEFHSIREGSFSALQLLVELKVDAHP